jgi:hypothetical protein
MLGNVIALDIHTSFDTFIFERPRPSWGSLQTLRLLHFNITPLHQRNIWISCTPWLRKLVLKSQLSAGTESLERIEGQAAKSIEDVTLLGSASTENACAVASTFPNLLQLFSSMPLGANAFETTYIHLRLLVIEFGNDQSVLEHRLRVLYTAIWSGRLPSLEELRLIGVGLYCSSDIFSEVVRAEGVLELCQKRSIELRIASRNESTFDDEGYHDVCSPLLWQRTAADVPSEVTFSEGPPSGCEFHSMLSPLLTGACL